MPRGVQVTWARSCFESAKARFPRPAKNTCQAVAATVGGPDCHFLASTDPKAQDKDPKINATDHHNSLLPRPRVEVNCGQIRVMVPLKPSASPARPRPETR